MLNLVKGIIIGLTVTLLSVSANAEMFGHNEEQYSDIRDFNKWNAVVRRQQLSMVSGDPYLDQWKYAVQQLSTLKTEQERIIATNNMVNNSITYEDDSQSYGVSDYWASPAETFARGVGDCEDYAIAKYFTLKALGVKEENLRIVVLKDTRKNELHAVLSVTSGGQNYILDNQSQQVLPDTQIGYYQPIYSINEQNWWKVS